MDIFIKLEEGESVSFTTPSDCNGFITKNVKKDILEKLDLHYEEKYIDEFIISPDNLLIPEETYTITPSRKMSAIFKLKDTEVEDDFLLWKLKVIAYGHCGDINTLYEDHIEFLIEEGYEVYFGCSQDYFELMIIEDNVEMLEIYINYGGEVYTKDISFGYVDGKEDIYDALVVAILLNSLSMVKLLRPYFDINEISREDKTYLMYAAESGNLEIVKYIMNDDNFDMLYYKRYCDCYGDHKHCPKGHTVLDVANSAEIVYYLKDNMFKCRDTKSIGVQCKLEE